MTGKRYFYVAHTQSYREGGSGCAASFVIREGGKYINLNEFRFNTLRENPQYSNVVITNIIELSGDDYRELSRGSL